ncbi:hypothetical protein RADP37_05554 [Roseomonas mucosa]|uniref:Uncharacterized protein n=1 Tax=Roseomonas mucosa TaxID=207340 RepID=A0A4Y1N005_9PROT|nr:hypothetical protein RADP37_05554 [Roseomonas mucosa]
MTMPSPPHTEQRKVRAEPSERRGGFPSRAIVPVLAQAWHRTVINGCASCFADLVELAFAIAGLPRCGNLVGKGASI